MSLRTNELLPWFSYEDIREMDWDGEPGSRMGWLVEGHLSDFDVQCFIGREMAEEYYEEGPARGFDVSFLWWSTKPYYDDEGQKIDGSYIYVYSDVEKPGYKKATRIEENSDWERWCLKHPEELAVVGMPLDRFVAGSEEGSPDGKNIYYCEPCYQDFKSRYAVALEAAMAELKKEKQENG